MGHQLSIAGAAGATLLLGLCAIGPASAQAPPYKGQTLSLVVGYAPGGGSDITCRIFANHLSRHVEGNPTIVVKNMPGASGANAMNYVGEVARQDGMTALCGTISILMPMLDDPAVRVDLTKFHFLAGVSDSQVMYVRKDIKPGMKTGNDIFKAENMVLGGFTVGSAKDIPARLALDLLGVKHRYVTGIRGDGAGRTAMQQGIINAWFEGLASYVAVTEPTMVKPGQAVVVFQSGLIDDNGEIGRPDPALPGVPTLREFYKAKFGKDPSGQLWDALNAILGPYAVSQRGLALPPNTPPAALKALEAGVGKMLKDDKFIADARKAMGEGVQSFAGERVQKTFTKALATPPAMKAFLKGYVETGKKLTGRK